MFGFATGLKKASLTAGFLFCSATIVGAGEFIVTGSTFDDVQIGDTLLSETELSLPVGAEVVLLPAKGAETFTLRGPYAGTIADYASSHTGEIDAILERIFENQAGLADCGTVEGGMRGDDCE